MSEENILSILNDVPMTRRELSRILEIDESKLSNILRKLKKEQIIELGIGKKWYITEKGRNLLNKTKELKEKLNRTSYKFSEEQEKRLLIISELYRVPPEKLMDTILSLLRSFYDLGIIKRISIGEIISNVSDAVKIIEILRKNNKSIEDVLLVLEDLEKTKEELENLKIREIEKIKELENIESEIRKKKQEYLKLSKHCQKLKEETEEFEKYRSEIINQIAEEAYRKGKEEVENLKREKELLEEKIKNLKCNLVLNPEWLINFLNYISFEIEKLENLSEYFSPLARNILSEEISGAQNSIRKIVRPLLNLLTENIKIVKEKVKNEKV